VTDIAILMVTAGSVEEAERIARTLLEERQIACANLVPGVRSLYLWQGKVEDAAEVLLLLKTPTALVEPVIERVRALHSYEVCEVLALPVELGNPAYVEWVRAETRPPE
jgi:periplasmic divalent cation tolerance protein